MADEQNITDGSFNLNQDLASQLPAVPPQTIGIPATDQIIYAPADAPQPPTTVQYANPAAINQTSYAYSAAASTIDPNSMMGKIKTFFTKPLGKVLLFTALFLSLGAMIMYSTGSVGLKGSFVNEATAPTITSIEPDSVKPGDSDKGIKLNGTNLAFLTQNIKAITFDDPNITSSGYTDGFVADGTTGHIFLNIKKETTPGTKKITITNSNGDSATFDLKVISDALTPSITSVSPAIVYGTDGYDTPFTINGSNLKDATAFFLKNSDGDDLVSFGYLDKVASDDTKIVGKLYVGKKATPGLKELTVKNSAGNTVSSLLEVKQNSSTSPTASSLTATPTTLLPGNTATLTIKGTNLKGTTLSGKDMTFIVPEPLMNSDTSLTVKTYVEPTAAAGTRDITITNTGGSYIYPKAITVVSANKPPLAPIWNAPAPNAELSLADLAKTEFKWTPGVDSDQGPSKTPNYQFAIIKGEIADQAEILKIFTGAKADINTKYGFAWITKWAEKATQEEIQKLIGGSCIMDINGNSSYTCEKFVIPATIAATMKEGQKYTAIVQQGDGATGSPYATTVFTMKKAEECPTNQYYIKDSKNSGCKKIPNFQGAFVQAGFICGLYKTILANPDNAYHLNSETKASLQTNISSQCSKKPDAVTNTCLTKMTYVPVGQALCEPLKIITDPALSKDVCDQYVVEKDNKSLSADTVKQIATIMGVQCKPKICPTGKFLNGILVPDDCADVMTFPTKITSYAIGKSCETMKIIAEATDALSIYRIDQPTLDQIKLAAKSEGCNPKFPAADDSSKAGKTAIITSTITACAKGYYLPITPSTLLEKNCKVLPNLELITSIADISDACKLYKDLVSGKIDGKMDAETTLRVQKSANDTLCDNTIMPTPKDTTLESADELAPPTLTMQLPVNTIVQPQSQPQQQQVQSNALDSLVSTANNEAPPSLGYPSQQQAVVAAPKQQVAVSTPRQYEALPTNQTVNYQPRYPVADTRGSASAAGTPAGASLGGSYVPRTTAKTGPEMWIYSFGLAFATIGSRRRKNKKK